MKKILIFWTAILIGIASAYAQSGTTGPLTWTLSSGTLTISGVGAMPNYYGNVPWSSYYSSITTVVINEGVTNIGDYAFRDCTGLISVTIGNSVTNIGHETFYGCTGLTSVTIPESVTSIENGAFSGCTGLTSVTIPNGVTSIGNYAFYGCTGLTSVTIPESVTWIEDSAFSDCTGLTSVTIPNSVTNIRNYAFSHCTGLTSVTIPNSVTSIEGRAFYGCTSLTTVNFNAENCTTMGGYNTVFESCTSLSTVNIGNDVKRIPNLAFYGCTGLTSITIPNSVTSIGGSAFSGCTGLTSVTIPESVTSIGHSAFSGCTSLTTVNFNAENCTTMGAEGGFVFADCTSLSTVNIGNNVKQIPNFAFSGCGSLTTVNFNAENCTTMGGYNGVFQGCTSLSTVNIGNDVKQIPNLAFSACARLTTVTISNSVTSIGHSAFYGCKGLTSITIGYSVTTIGDWAFSSCTSLQNVFVKQIIPLNINWDVFSYVDMSKCVLFVPKGSLADYQAADVWNNFGNIVEANVWELFVHKDRFDFTPAGGTNAVTVFSQVDWKANVSGSWLTLDTDSAAAGITRVTMTVAKNTSASNRSATLTFRGEDAEDCVITVVQAGDELLIVGGEAKTGALPRDGQKVYRLSLNENQTVRITDSNGLADIAVAYEQEPDISRAQHGNAYISNSMAGDYYVMLSNNGLNARPMQEYRLTATALSDLEIAGVFADTVVRCQSTLIPVEVIGCSEIPKFALVGANGKHYEAEKVHVFSETLFSAQFRVDSLAVGAYGFYASAGDKSRLKEKAVYLKAENPRESLKTKIVLPSTGRIGTTISAYVEYVNTGNVDIPAPLLVLSGTEGSTYQVGDGEIYKDEIHLMGLNPMGVLNRLRPGEGGRIEVKIGIPNEQIRTADYKLNIFSRNAEGMDAPFYLQWLDVEPSVKPSSYTQEEWDGYISRLRGLTGETWSSFVEGLSVVEGYLMNSSMATLDAREVYGYMKEIAIQKDGEELTSVSLKNSTIDIPGDVEPGTIFLWKNNNWIQLVKKENGEWKTIDEACGLINKAAPLNFFLSHGWNDTREGLAAKGIASALTERHGSNGCNIFTVDWSAWSYTGGPGENGTIIKPLASTWDNYLKTPNGIPIHFRTYNIPIVNSFVNANAAGAKISETAKIVVSNMQKAINTNMSKIVNNLHLIGHSHGAHVCGLVAKEFGKFGEPERMTALDASTDISHINFGNWAGTGWKNCAKYIDYYKSSIMASADHFHGNDNFILIENDNGFIFKGRTNSTTEKYRHEYAIKWYIATINGDKKSVPLGFNFTKTVRNNLKWGGDAEWNKKTENRWHGVVNGTRNTIECLSVRDQLEIEHKEKWRYTEPWYSGSIQGSIISDTKFRDALAGTLELDINNEESVIVPENELKVGTGKQIDIYIKNRADNHTISHDIRDNQLWSKIRHNLFLLPESNLSTKNLKPIKQLRGIIDPGSTRHYYPSINITEETWKNIGGNDNVDYIDCLLILKAGMYEDSNKDPFNDYWKGELYTDNNTAKVNVRVRKAPITCDAGPDITVTDNNNEGKVTVTREGYAKSDIGEIKEYWWHWNGNIISRDKTLIYDFPVGGPYELTFYAYDGENLAQDDLIIEVKPYTPPGDEGDSGSTSTIGSWDPNEKVGVKGAGDKDCVLPGNSMDYTVFFENDPEKANAPAQEVRVTDVLDEAFDLSTFSFTGAKVANQDIAVQGNVAHTSVITDLRPENNLLLQTTLNLDIDTRTVTAVFSSLDTETEEFPLDPWAGFLLPNDSTHRGEGRFSYRVALKENIADGYEIKNRAMIYFDRNDPIETNTTSHTIDLLAPASRVSDLPASTEKDSVLIAWSGNDSGSGVKNHTIYLSDNGGNFTPWKTKITETSAYFYGKAAHTYSFFSIATDWIGHVEGMKNRAEATIQFKTGTHVPDITADAPESVVIYPNPATESFRIHGIGENTLLTLSDITGKIVLQQTVGPDENVSISRLSKGIYLVGINGKVMKMIKN